MVGIRTNESLIRQKLSRVGVKSSYLPLSLTSCLQKVDLEQTVKLL